MQNNYLKIAEAFAKRLREATDTQVIILPSEVKSEKFHFELSFLPHPVIIGNGRARLRLRAELFAEIPASNTAINDCLEHSLKAALFFDEVQNFTIDEGAKFYGLCYPQAIKPDDEIFLDIIEPRSYSYTETWILELEFNIEHNHRD